MTVCSLEWVYINQNFVFWAHTARWETGTEGTFPPARENRFTIYPYDPVTGVYFAHARLYDADLGRMLSKDPVKRGLNGYPYCGNDPVNHTDPTGEIPTVLLFGAGGGILGGIAGFAGSALDQLSSGDEFSLRRALGSAANGMVKGAVKGALSGAATSGLGYLSDLIGRQPKSGQMGHFPGGTVARTPYERLMDPRGICILQDVFGGGLGIRKAYGYRYEMRDPDQPVRDGFDLGDFLRSTLTGGLMGGLSGVAFYGMDKAVGALKGSLSGGSKDNPYKKLYRAVSPEEYDDVFKTGGFRATPDGRTFEAKEFGNSLEDTLNFANHPINVDKAAILEVTIPKSIYNQLNHMSLDTPYFKSGTTIVEPDLLNIFNKSISKIRHVY